jgi:hypothetical protein
MNDQPNSLLIAEVDYSEAKEFADIASIVQDLNLCMKMCERLIESLDSGREDPVLQASLWTSAIIGYARCFATGKRFGISDKYLSRLNGDPVGAHKFFMNMRDKHIAHSVNPFEQTKIGLVLSDPEMGKKVIGIVNISQRHITATKNGVDTLRRLCGVIRDKLANDLEVCRQEAIKAGESLPIEQLYAKSHMYTVTPGPDDAGKARKSY